MPLFKDARATIRRFAFSEHNWHDYEAHGRSVRGEGFIFVRNHRPQFAWQGPADSVRSPSHVRLQELRDAGRLTATQADVFLAPRPRQELYRMDSDPHQLVNLAADPAYKKQKTRLSKVLDQWMDETGDSVPEHITPDLYHRERGTWLNAKRGEAIPPGADRGATKINAPGPH